MRSELSDFAAVVFALLTSGALGLSIYQVGVLVAESETRRRERVLLLRRANEQLGEGRDLSVSHKEAALDVLTSLRSWLEKSLFWQKLVQPRLTRGHEAHLREACVNDLPEMVDMLALSLGAGLSFDQAMERYVAGFDTPLAHEFGVALKAYQVGMCSRVRAFEDVAERVGEEAVLRFVACVRQAATLGSSLAASFDVLSFEVRRYRKARLEERIAKTPVKLLVPLGVCILPAVLLLLMGPVMMQVLSGLNL